MATPARRPIRPGEGRLPEHGRIRLGVKAAARNGRGSSPKKLTTFRFTSSDETAIRTLAELYGALEGPREWNESGHIEEWELITAAKEIRIWLPPEPLSPPVYELWGGGRRLERRCDTYTCTKFSDTPEGLLEETEDCPCWASGDLVCKPNTMLSVILPDVGLGGTWRLKSNGDNAWKELPTMVQLIQDAGRRGFKEALLFAEQRTNPRNARDQYVVPVLRLPVAIKELAAGGGQALAVGGAGPVRAALPVASYTPVDDVVDAEVVEPGVVNLQDHKHARLIDQVRQAANDLMLASDTDTLLNDLVAILTVNPKYEGPWVDLSHDRLLKLLDKLADLEAGRLEWHASDDANPHGRLVRA